MADHADALTPPSLETKTTFAMLRVAALLSDELDAELKEASGLGLSELQVILQIVFAGGRAKMADLADNLVVTRGGVTKIVDRLVDGGYLARVPSEEDRRVVYAEVTDKASDVIRQHQPLFETVTARRVGAMLATDELEAMHDWMHRLSCDNPGWEPPEAVRAQHPEHAI